MSTIHIQWMVDSHRCSTCGTNYAEGAIVYVDGKQALDLEPVAHCFDGKSYKRDTVYAAVLKHLGHTVTEEEAE